MRSRRITQRSGSSSGSAMARSMDTAVISSAVEERTSPMGSTGRNVSKKWHMEAICHLRCTRCKSDRAGDASASTIDPFAASVVVGAVAAASATAAAAAGWTVRGDAEAVGSAAASMAPLLTMWSACAAAIALRTVVQKVDELKRIGKIIETEKKCRWLRELGKCRTVVPGKVEKNFPILTAPPFVELSTRCGRTVMYETRWLPKGGRSYSARQVIRWLLFGPYSRSRVLPPKAVSSSHCINQWRHSAR